MPLETIPVIVDKTLGAARLTMVKERVDKIAMK